MEDSQKPELKLAISSPNNLKFVRESLGIRMTELVKGSGVSRVTISDIEKGKRTGNTVTRYKLLNALNLISGKDYDLKNLFP